MTPAEELRAAARLMRERAEGCEPRRWYWEPLGGKRYPQRISSEGNSALIAETFIDPGHRPFEAEHIAGMHPGVALAVADWLDRFGDELYCYGPAEFDHALAIARAYLAPEIAAKESGR